MGSQKTWKLNSSLPLKINRNIPKPKRKGDRLPTSNHHFLGGELLNFGTGYPCVNVQYLSLVCCVKLQPQLQPKYLDKLWNKSPWMFRPFWGKMSFPLLFTTFWGFPTRREFGPYKLPEKSLENLWGLQRPKTPWQSPAKNLYLDEMWEGSTSHPIDN